MRIPNNPEWPGPNFVRDRILARHQEDFVEDVSESVDTGGNVRGKGKEFKSSLREIAIELGMTEHPNPEQAVSYIVKSATKKFIRNYYCMIVSNACQKIGYPKPEADDFAKSSLMIEETRGSNISELVKGMVL